MDAGGVSGSRHSDGGRSGRRARKGMGLLRRDDLCAAPSAVHVAGAGGAAGLLAAAAGARALRRRRVPHAGAQEDSAVRAGPRVQRDRTHERRRGVELPDDVPDGHCAERPLRSLVARVHNYCIQSVYDQLSINFIPFRFADFFTKEPLVNF